MSLTSCRAASRLLGVFCPLGFSSVSTAQTPPARDPISDGVGATAGQFEVDATGNAAYTIPIFTPPGTAGVEVKDQIDTSPRSCRYYALSYSEAGSGSRAQLLRFVKECRTNPAPGGTPDPNAICYRPTNFAWSDAAEPAGTLRACLAGTRVAAQAKGYKLGGRATTRELRSTQRTAAIERSHERLQRKTPAIDLQRYGVVE